jgi:hypothetical protein
MSSALRVEQAVQLIPALHLQATAAFVMHPLSCPAAPKHFLPRVRYLPACLPACLLRC